MHLDVLEVDEKNLAKNIDITLIGKDTLTLDQDSNNNETVADISALQQAILKGTDLNALEETAAGGPQAGGNGGNGGGDRTPIIPTVTPVVTPNENTPADPGQVLGVDRPISVDNAVSVEEKKGEVLGATRPSTKAVATRATVSTGDNHYSALWASLFGLSLASLAGFVVLRKKEQN